MKCHPITLRQLNPSAQISYKGVEYPQKLVGVLALSDAKEVAQAVCDAIVQEMSKGIRNFPAGGVGLELFGAIRIEVAANGRQIFIYQEILRAERYEHFMPISKEIDVDLQNLFDPHAFTIHAFGSLITKITGERCTKSKQALSKSCISELECWIWQVIGEYLGRLFDFHALRRDVKKLVTPDPLTYAVARRFLGNPHVRCADFNWCGLRANHLAAWMISEPLFAPTLAAVWSQPEFYSKDEPFSVLRELLIEKYGPKFGIIHKYLIGFPNAFPQFAKEIGFHSEPSSTAYLNTLYGYLDFVLDHHARSESMFVLSVASNWVKGVFESLPPTQQDLLLDPSWHRQYPQVFWRLALDHVNSLVSENEIVIFSTELKLTLAWLLEMQFSCIRTGSWASLVAVAGQWLRNQPGSSSTGLYSWSWPVPQLPKWIEGESRLYVFPLDTPYKLFEEGIKQKNCAFMYANRTAHPAEVIVSLRTHVGNSYKRVVTVNLHISKAEDGKQYMTLRQIAHSCNRSASDSLTALVKEAL